MAAPLTFGTAGLRGPLRAGPAGMNLAVVRRAAAGIAAYLRGTGIAAGPWWSATTAGTDPRSSPPTPPECLPRQGFSVLLAPGPLPTPMTAFAVRHLDAAAGVQVTASHNPPQDNGLKVYLAQGAQLVAPEDGQIEAAIAAGPAGPRHRRRRRSPPRRGRTTWCRPTWTGSARSARSRRRRPVGPDPGRDHPDARRRRRNRRQGIASGRIHRRARGARTGRAGRRLPDRAVPEPGGAGRDRPAAGAGRSGSAPPSPSPSTRTPTGAPSASRCRRRLADADRRRDRRAARRSPAAHPGPRRAPRPAGGHHHRVRRVAAADRRRRTAPGTTRP